MQIRKKIQGIKGTEELNKKAYGKNIEKDLEDNNIFRNFAPICHSPVPCQTNNFEVKSGGTFIIE